MGQKYCLFILLSKWNSDKNFGVSKILKYFAKKHQMFIKIAISEQIVKEFQGIKVSN